MKSSIRRMIAFLCLGGSDRPRWPGEIPWRYSVSEMRADAVVHAMGLAFAVAALVDLHGNALGRPSRNDRRHDLPRCPGEFPGHVGALQSLAGLPWEMDPAPLRPRGHLSAHRRNLHAVHDAARHMVAPLDSLVGRGRRDQPSSFSSRDASTGCRLSSTSRSAGAGLCCATTFSPPSRRSACG